MLVAEKQELSLPLTPFRDDSPLDLSLENVREVFPITRSRAYLNNASIAPASTLVMSAMDHFMSDVRDNGRNRYPLWCDYAETAIKGRVGAMIGAKASEIAFVKNTTEGLVTVANGLDWRKGDNVLLPDIEYPSNVYCWMKLAKLGVEIRWIKARNGRIELDDIAALMDSRTRLLSLSAVQFSNGFKQDLAAVSELCSKKKVLLNLDAIQWVGNQALNLAEIHVDFLSFGGHKWFLAPIGTGIFYCNEKSIDLLDPPSVGYHTVDRGEAHMDYILDYRPGAARFEEALVNFPGIWGLDAAVRMHLAVTPIAAQEKIASVVSYAAERLQSRGWRIISPRSHPGETSGLLSFTKESLDVEKVAKSMNSAGVDLAVRAGALRISPSFYNDESDIDRMMAALESC
ncbi:aminotransferase class V-fold PLP-dependent enzyme [Paraburkholderia sabiae]|uniref:Aminotransferase class V-fold PLP-dependent enzyme n=1 Tax=Paraburkholderia sabiae TaxID=273251 RepID=A0ABU9QLK2_9BURK|nr:aminotransferase class V-fold PLP-dependent enzyme [Paraburkholderia sabiae]WJZ79682.1 aminotransferase class V-fold PLP-dependent enzyme [Paraburkholderia sabiae]CAD6560744.1 putative cysteine desulfurase [Paraburkholderia sabiae]